MKRTIARMMFVALVLPALLGVFGGGSAGATPKCRPLGNTAFTLCFERSGGVYTVVYREQGHKPQAGVFAFYSKSTGVTLRANGNYADAFTYCGYDNKTHLWVLVYSNYGLPAQGVDQVTRFKC